MDCTNCVGRGLVSTGADPRNLEVGGKTTCAACNGTGKVAEQAEVIKTQEEILPSRLTIINPKVGDACLTADDEPGTLQLEGDGSFVCVRDPKVESPSSAENGGGALEAQSGASNAQEGV